MSESMTDKRVLVTTEWRGVFYGRLDSYDRDKRRAVLSDARNIIRFGTTAGLWQLASTGPAERTKLGSTVALLDIPGVTSVALVSAEAVAKWSA